MVRDEWVGDIGDFARSGLLRKLFGTPDNPVAGPKLGVVWCWNNADISGTYIETPEEYSHLDQPLYDSLGKLCGDRRTIAEFQCSRILPTDIYFDEPISDLTREQRANWLRAAITRTREADVIFVDPDTGVAPEGMTRRDGNTRRRSNKHIYLDELKPFVDKGKSLIIYQHIGQGIPKDSKAEEHIRELSGRLRNELNPVHQLWAFHWRRRIGRVFFIVANTEKHTTQIDTRLRIFRESQWFTGDHFTEVPV